MASSLRVRKVGAAVGAGWVLEQREELVREVVVCLDVVDIGPLKRDGR